MSMEDFDLKPSSKRTRHPTKVALAHPIPMTRYGASPIKWQHCLTNGWNGAL
jgi:hypothetical protein